MNRGQTTRAHNPGDNFNESAQLSTPKMKTCKLSLLAVHAQPGLPTAFQSIQVLDKKGENTALHSQAVPLSTTTNLN
jgi:hypothetical protein